MPRTIDELRHQLSAIEPTERTYSGISGEDAHALRELIASDEEWLAARAVHALARIRTEGAFETVVNAAQDNRLEVRAAAASVASNLPASKSNRILNVLIEDESPAVRKIAIASVSSENSAEIKDLLTHRAQRDPFERVQRTARDVLSKLP